MKAEVSAVSLLTGVEDGAEEREGAEEGPLPAADLVPRVGEGTLVLPLPPDGLVRYDDDGVANGHGSGGE